MKKVVWGILKPLLMLYVIGGILLYVLQRDLLYKIPEFSKHDYPVKLIKNEGETLKIAVLNEGKEKAIIYFGGNSEWVLSTAKRRATQFSNYTVYLVNYRGYGGSTGTPTEAGLYSDSLVIYDTLKKEHKNVYLLGRSLGSGVASYVASKREVKKLALVTPYDSILNVAQGKYPMYPLGLMLKDRFDSVENLSNLIDTKILVLIAEGDKIIPNEHTYALVETMNKSQVQVEVIKGELHNTISHQQKYFDILNGFFEN